MQSFGHLRLRILHEAHGEFSLIFFFKKKILKHRKNNETESGSVMCIYNGLNQSMNGITLKTVINL